jgi:A/G-specific adenine glycosylase
MILERNQIQITDFQNKILDFYAANKRELRWRYTDNPYYVLVSEFMLQQTQVSRVIEKFDLFTTHFPTIFDVASASFSAVLFCWQGLGYNRRAKYIHQAAKIIVEKYDGVIPDNIADLQAISGIGPYTASAIVTFAYNKPEVFIETNVRTVFLHEFFQNEYNVHDLRIRQLIAQTIDQKNPRSWYYALMDYGSHLKKMGKNASRNSAHYTKQSPFLGSRRQLRGKIIALLTQHGSIHHKNLKGLIFPEDIRFDEVVITLQKEEMIDIVHDHVFIKNTNRK